MDKAQAEWNKIPWQKFDAAKLCPRLVTLADWEKPFTEAKKEYPKVEPAKKELWALRDLAAKLANTWKANKLIPKAGVAHVEQIAKTADQLSVALKSLDENFLEIKRTWERLEAAAKSTLPEFSKRTQHELAKPSTANWFGRDFLRFLEGYRIVKDGKVIRERGSNMDAKTTLTRLVEALGSSGRSRRIRRPTT